MMKRHSPANPSKRSGRTTISFAVAVIASVSVVHASARGTVVLVPPANLPELARHSGESVLLPDTIDGRKLLYIEQSGGATLAVLDVTEPGHIIGEGSLRLDAQVRMPALLDRSRLSVRLGRIVGCATRPPQPKAVIAFPERQA